MYSEDVKRVDIDKKLELIRKMADSKIAKLKAELDDCMIPYMQINSEDTIVNVVVATERLKYYQMAINDMFEWLKMMEG